MQVIITINSVAPGSSLGPNFTLSADVGSVVPNIATLAELLAGKLVTIDSNATVVFATSLGECDTVVDFPIATTTTSTSTTSTSTTSTSTSTTTTSTSTTSTSTTTSSTTTTTTTPPEICFAFEQESVGDGGQFYLQLSSSGNLPPQNGRPAYNLSSVFGVGVTASVYFDGVKWIYFNSDFGGVFQTLNTASNYPISDGVNPPLWTPNTIGSGFTGGLNTSVFGVCPTTTTTTSTSTTTTSSTTTTTTQAPTCCTPTLTSITNIGSGLLINYTLNANAGCKTCNGVTIQTSTNGISWSSTTGGCVSPAGLFSIPGVITFYRAVVNCSDSTVSVPSNILTFTPTSPTTTTTTSSGGGGGVGGNSTWEVRNVNCGTGTINSVSINGSSMGTLAINTFPLISTQAGTKFNPSGINYGTSSNSIQVNVTSPMAGSGNCAVLRVRVNGGASTYQTLFTSNPFPQISGVTINPGDFVEVEVSCQPGACP